jgi:small subunit ribosomal protein S4e
MTHQKRLSAPKHYPVERKDAAYVITGKGPHDDETGVPLAVLLRDVLGYADDLSEAREILSSRNITVNGRTETDPQRTIGFMDVITIDKLDTDLRVSVDKDGLVFNEVEDGDRRLRRVEDKTTVTGGRTQLNLDGGENMIVDEDFGTRGTIVLEDEDIIASVPFEEGSLAYVTGGQHVGELAEIVDIDIIKGSQPNRVTLKGEDGEFETIEDYVYVIGEDEPEVEV